MYRISWAVLMIASCPMFAPLCAQEAPAPPRRYVVFWCSKPQDVKNATHVTPQVFVPGDATVQKKYPDYPQAFWLKRGVVPLRWKGGNCYRDKSEDELVQHWASAARQGYRGIAIDELGDDRGGPIDRKMARALGRVRKLEPKLFIAVWQARRTSDVLWKAYAEAADLVLLERYVHGTTELEHKFGPLADEARQAGVIGKTIFALGINDLSKDKAQGRWANSAEELEAQVRWVRDHARGMPGVAFFAPEASPELVRVADELAGRYFPQGK